MRKERSSQLARHTRPEVASKNNGRNHTVTGELMRSFKSMQKDCLVKIQVFPVNHFWLHKGEFLKNLKNLSS